MDVGGALRDAREQRGLSLDQLAQATKIRVTTLHAIETNQRGKLPELIFLRGFVRAYAREVGLSPEDTVKQYLSQFDPVTRIVESAKAGTDETYAEHLPAVGSEADRDKTERRVTRVQWIGLVILVIGVAAYYTAPWWRAPAPPAAHATPLANAPEIAGPSSSGGSPTAAATARVEAATTGSGELTVAGATANDLLHLDIRAQDLCWLSATVDGTLVVYRLMQPGEQHTIDVHDEAAIRVGNPAAFAFSINGRKGRVLGRSGEAVTVRITPQNYREFLRRQN
jgi:cytoskeletal protein RodZ